MNKEELKKRTKQFALRVIRLVETLPRTQTAQVLGNQLLRSTTSVAANYRVVFRARSPADFLHKLGIVDEEADELPAIFIASRKTGTRQSKIENDVCHENTHR